MSKKWNIENVTPSLFIQFAKVQQQKRIQEYQSMGPEFGTGKINCRILELLLRQFCSLIFVPPRKF